MAFPTVQSSAISGDTASTADFNATMPTGIAAGDALVAFAECSSAQTWPTPTGWTQKDTVTGNSKTTWCWAKVATGSDTMTVVRSGGSGNIIVAIYRIDGWLGSIGGIEADIISIFDNPDPPNLTPSWGSADTLWIAGGGGLPSSQTFPTNYTSNQLNSDTGGNTDRMQTATRNLTATSEDPGVFGTAGTLGHSFALTAAVQPATGATSNPARNLSLLGVG